MGWPVVEAADHDESACEQVRGDEEVEEQDQQPLRVARVELVWGELLENSAHLAQPQDLEDPEGPEGRARVHEAHHTRGEGRDDIDVEVGGPEVVVPNERCVLQELVVEHDRGPEHDVDVRQEEDVADDVD